MFTWFDAGTMWWTLVRDAGFLEPPDRHCEDITFAVGAGTSPLTTMAASPHLRHAGTDGRSLASRCPHSLVNLELP